MAEDFELKCDKSTEAKAIRGPLTAWMLHKRGLNLSRAIFADPAILVARFYPNTLVKITDPKMVVIPHYADCDRAMKLPWGEYCQLISPMKDIEVLLKMIASADCVITSSLHILIAAEAYHVPAVWVEFSDSVRGGGYKFWDWYLSTIRNPPAAVQIRGDKIPWNQIYDAVYDWTGPSFDIDEMCNLLLDACPFEGVV
jgi:pyruvyltransferase